MTLAVQWDVKHSPSNQYFYLFCFLYSMALLLVAGISRNLFLLFNISIIA